MRKVASFQFKEYCIHSSSYIAWYYIKISRSYSASFHFFLDKIRNIAMSPELHSPTVTVFSPAKIYNRKMKLYTSVCLTSYQMILLMNKTTHYSYFTEIIILSRLKECCLFVTVQIITSVTGVLSLKRRSINNSTCMLNSLGEGEMI